MHPWHDVELPRSLAEPIPAIVEIPTGSSVKLELDKKSGLLAVDRILFSAVHYPANYGFVPRTYCDDGDPRDILVYCQEPIEPLSIMRARVVGVMKMHDESGEDDKLISVHADDPEYDGVSNIADLPPFRMRELRRFFQDYKALENKQVRVGEPQGKLDAMRVLDAAVRLYRRERARLIAPLPSAMKGPARRSPAPRGAPGRH